MKVIRMGYLSTEDAARMIGVHPKVLLAMCKSGDGPERVWLGGHYQYKESRVKAWINARERKERTRLNTEARQRPVKRPKPEPVISTQKVEDHADDHARVKELVEKKKDERQEIYSSPCRLRKWRVECPVCNKIHTIMLAGYPDRWVYCPEHEINREETDEEYQCLVI